MPYSADENKEWMKLRFQEIGPASVVDIGPGSGAYSNLLRSAGCEWKAIEAWGPYVSQFSLFDKYDHVVIADVRHCDLYSVHVKPDLVIAGDVLEHLSKDEAICVIGRLKSWGRNLLVSIPNDDYPQGPHEGNWFEIHRATWAHEEMELLLSDGLIDSSRGDVVSSYYWRSE